MTLDNSFKIKNGNNNSQKRSNSIIDDNEKNFYKNSIKYNGNVVYSKYVPSTSYKNYSNIKSTFNSLIAKQNNNLNNKMVIPSHMKNSSLFSSTINSLYKPKNYYIENKVISKTSNPTSKNSRKNSNDKRTSVMNNSNIQSSN